MATLTASSHPEAAPDSRDDASVSVLSTTSTGTGTSSSSKRRSPFRAFLSHRQSKRKDRIAAHHARNLQKVQSQKTNMEVTRSAPSPSPLPSPAAQLTAALAFEVEEPHINEPHDSNPEMNEPPELERKQATELTTEETTESSSTQQQQEQQQEQQNHHHHHHHHHHHSNWLTRTQTFKDICDKAFDMIDTDNSNSVDEKELYSGLLLIHLKLGCYAGPAACRPLGRDRCHKVFMEYDDNEQGVLNRQEFQNVMVLLFSNVLMRVLVQWSMTILIVPLIARHMLEAFYATCFFIYECIVNADEYSEIANQIELAIEAIGAFIWNTLLPTAAVNLLQTFVKAWNAVPDSVWNAAPLSLISTILGILVVPWLILQVDDFFQYLSETGADKLHEEEEACNDNTEANNETSDEKKDQ